MFVRATVGWVAILGVAIINGGLRDRFLRPRVGFLATEIYGASVLSLATVIAALIVMRPYANNYPAATRVSVFWVVLTLAFEFLFFHYVARRSWNELFSAYKFWDGRLWSVVVLVVIAAPFMATKWLASSAPGLR